MDFFAVQGFVVLQPTHQDPKALGLDPQGPEGPLFWRSRAEDMHVLLDHLDQIEAAVPGLSGRLDRNQLAVLGHSMGGHTVAMLAGMRLMNPADNQEVNLTEPRLKAYVLLGAPGDGTDLAAFAAEHYSILGKTSFDQMTAPALVVNGDEDQSPRFSAQADWRADAYHRSPGPKCLLTVFGGQHILGVFRGTTRPKRAMKAPSG
ncbi:MAG: hypothetical protein WKG07_02040 [Hymenobacter sp.]